MNVQAASGLMLPDPVAMAVALEPNIIERQGKYFVDVEITSELTRGAIVVDELKVLGKTPNMTVIWAINTSRWK
jgi:purine nucleosidase